MVKKKTAKPTDPTVDSLPTVDTKPTRVRIRHQNPKVADHVAKVLIKNAMDMESAVKELAPELSPVRVAEVCDLLEESETVRQAIANNLRASGLDEDSKDRFVKKMWSWVDSIEDIILDPNTGQVDILATTLHRTSMKDFALAGARILSKGFISDKVVDNKPAALPIKGWGEGVSKMLGGEEPVSPDAANSSPDVGLVAEKFDA